MTEPDRDIIKIAPSATSMREIAEDVASKWGLTLAELKGPARCKRVSHPRQEAYARIYATDRFSTTQIGLFFGGRDHTTVLHGIRAHERRMAEGEGA